MTMRCHADRLWCVECMLRARSIICVHRFAYDWLHANRGVGITPVAQSVRFRPTNDHYALAKRAGSCTAICE
eukprot:6202219-Pleurochrysis_carterae.AAC.2